MTQKETVSFRVGKSLSDRVAEFRRQHDMSESDAYRELVRRGLEYEEMEQRFEHMNSRLDNLEQQLQEQQSQGFFSRFLK